MSLSGGTGGRSRQNQYSVVMPDTGGTTFTATTVGSTSYPSTTASAHFMEYLFDGSNRCDVSGTCKNGLTGEPSTGLYGDCGWLSKPNCPTSFDLVWSKAFFVTSLRIDPNSQPAWWISDLRVLAHPPANAVSNSPVDVTPPFIQEKLRDNHVAWVADQSCDEDPMKWFLDIPVGLWVNKISLILTRTGDNCALGEIEVLYDPCGPTSRPGTNWETGLQSFLAQLSHVDALANATSAGSPSCLLTVH